MSMRRFTFVLVALCMAGSVGAAERHMMQPVVPADKAAEARALKNPLPNSPEVVEQGKALYNGKGGCVTCHGIDGDGKGPGAVSMNPAHVTFSTTASGDIAPRGKFSGPSSTDHPGPP